MKWLFGFNAKYKHFYAKDVSTHPSMVSTHQHRFKGNMCKNVETVSTQVKSVSTRVEVFQVDTLSEQVDIRPSSQNNQFEELGQQVDTLKSRSTRDLLPRTAFSIFGTVCRHYHQGSLHIREGPNSLRASKKLLAAKKSSCLLPLLSKCFQKTNSHQFKAVEPPDLFEPSEKLFKLITEGTQAMVDKETSSSKVWKGPSLSELARGKVLPRGKKVASRPEKHARAPEVDQRADVAEEEERAAKRPRRQPTSPSATPSGLTQPREQILSPTDWGRQSLPTETKADALTKRPRQLIDDFYSSVLCQMSSFEAFLHRAEAARLLVEKRLVEADKGLAVEKALRVEEAELAKKTEDELRAALRAKKNALQAEKEALIEEVRAHEDQGANREKVAGLFQEGYNSCLERVRKLHADLDLSEAVLPAQGDEEDDGEVAAVVNEALSVAIDKTIAEAADNVIAKDSLVPQTE
ncbi:hypothetical protein Taro_047211 [Colocasia esculenta]|uniref:Uncharacterized protein n=1 Tax=Colocasia esculenta TaxID=4460 RepID=A0A843X561_COLES|nr:hypothetical protein [Colocasia esculenta]